MKNRIAIVFLIAGASAFITTDASAQWWPFRKKQSPVADTSKVKKEDKQDLKPYSQVITSDAITQEGVFKVHRVKNDYYFELPITLLERQFLVVNKLSKVAEQLNDAGVNKGMNFENIVISFELDSSLRRIFVRKDNPFYEAPPSDAIARSVADNFLPALIDFFPIEAFSKDKQSVVFKVNKVFDGSSTSLNSVFNALGFGSSAVKDLSRIVQMKAFERNVVVKSEFTTRVTDVPLSVEVTSNLVLLSETPMVPRFADPRVGYFSTPRWYFSDEQQSLDKRQLVTRWRLEPKPEDKQRYALGELVEPVKPIIYYVDPATPPKWRSYIKKGIEDWQKAFEEAGFKNAIIGMDAPANDPDFDPDNTTYSVVTYAASAKANAMGPSVVDPRSGEIIEADIIWWHNVMSLLQSWMRVQTGVIDSGARGNDMDDELMGQAIRFVSSHEVGHTLGLKHNMGSSFSFPVDSLRSPTFTSRMGGTAPSIMDYARFNYVAQPEDKVVQITPVIGVYDKYAIAWAYRYLDAANPHSELPTLNAWIRAHEKDPMYHYGPQEGMRDGIDPSAQSEDLGNDAMKASRYGIKNLKRIMPQITKWTEKEGDSYLSAGRLLSSVIGQWNLYAYHVLTNIGGIYLNQTVYGEQTDTYRHVEKERQREAVNFLIDEVFETPKWLFTDSIYRKTYQVNGSPMGPIEVSPVVSLKNVQSYIYYDLLREERIARMIENETANGTTKAYTVSELLTDLHKGVFKTTIAGGDPDLFERNSQKGYVDALIISVDIVTEPSAPKKTAWELGPLHLEPICGHDECNASNEGRQADRTLLFVAVKRVSDGISAKRGEMRRIVKLLESKLNTKDGIVRDHYMDIIFRINKALATN